MSPEMKIIKKGRRVGEEWHEWRDKGHAGRKRRKKCLENIISKNRSQESDEEEGIQ